MATQLADGFQVQPAAALTATSLFNATVGGLAAITGNSGITAASSAAFAPVGAEVAAADTGLAGQLTGSLSRLITLLRGIGQDLVTAIEGYVAADDAVAASLGGQQSGNIPPNEQQIPKAGTRSAGLSDYAVRAEMEVIAAAFRAKGWTHAADMLDHYLANTGTNATVDPQQIMKDVPNLNNAVTNYVAGQTPGSGTYDSGWHNINTDIRDSNGKYVGTQSSDWYYAMHDFRYRVTGNSTMVNGQRVDDYTVDVYKPYIFGGNRAPLTIPYTGIKQPQDSIQGLHDSGLAQDFIITGSSHIVSTH